MKHPIFVKAFGEHIKTLRIERNLSQQNLADLSDVDIRTIQRIEQNLHNPTIDVVYSIALALKLDIKELFNFEF